MNNREIKEAIIKSLYDRNVYIRQVSKNEYRTRCPYCGDSQKNLNTGHLYVKINVDNNLPVVYHCFKCEASGIANSEFLSTMEIDDINLKSSITQLNKTSDKFSSAKFINGEENIFFDYEIPAIKRGKKTEYIENRLGRALTNEELKKMKLITSLKDFLLFNKIKTITLDKMYVNKLEDHYVGFLSFGNSHILFRDITNSEEYSWIKYPITEESKKCRLLYSMENEIDVFTNENIEINVSEGVFDILSCAFNLDHNNKNTVNIAVCGKYYISTLEKLLNLGICGNNVIVNIFADNDEKFNKKNNNPTTPDYFKKLLYKFKYIYGNVNIYYNQLNKDIGVPKEQISLKKIKL